MSGVRIAKTSRPPEALLDDEQVVESRHTPTIPLGVDSEHWPSPALASELRGRSP
jgi:hypothetical protein